MPRTDALAIRNDVFAMGLGGERPGDGRRAAGPGEGGFVVGAFRDRQSLLALVGRPAGEPLVERAAGLRQVGRVAAKSHTWRHLLVRNGARPSREPVVASVGRARAPLMPATRYVVRAARPLGCLAPVGVVAVPGP